MSDDDRADPRRLLIDTDPGVDDTAAILFAFGSPSVTVEALTVVWGNTDAEHCLDNALRVVEALGADDVPVYRGATGPLIRDTDFLGRYVHGQDGLGDIGFPQPRRSASPGRAAEQIVERVMAAPGAIDLVALGPLTNVATALALEPRVAHAVRSLVVMGGAVYEPGNITGASTANLWNDPEAAALVYRSGAPIVQVGMEVCRPMGIPPSTMEALAAVDHPAVRLLVAATPMLAIVDADPVTGGHHYNDVPAMAYALNPAHFETERLYIEIQHDGSEQGLGQTIGDIRGIRFLEPNVTLCTGVDRETVLADFTTALTIGLERET